MISKGNDGTLHTKIYRKKTATNSLLQWSSCHPRPLVRGIPKGQFLRVRRNCSDATTFRSQSQELKTRFQSRGYPDKVIQGAYQEALKKDRTTLLTPKKREREGPEMRIIGQFDTHSERVRKILERHWDILALDESLKGLLPPRPLIT